jgi:hypothetical protein
MKKASYTTPRKTKKLSTNQLRKKALYKAAQTAFDLNRPDNMIKENKLAYKYDIPKYLRQYAKRYGGIDVLSIVQTHKKHTLET